MLELVARGDLTQIPISPTLPRETFKTGSVIVREGDLPGAVYIVAIGRVQVSKEGYDIAEIGPDGIFGDMALIDNSPRSATVTALEDTECFVISVDEFRRILSMTHPLMQAITKVLASRLRQMTSAFSKEQLGPISDTKTQH